MPALSMFYGIIVRMQSEKVENIVNHIFMRCMEKRKL